MWGHRVNTQTELWTSGDGLHFEHQGVSITAENVGPSSTVRGGFLT
jgi:hypothetical protein